MTLSRLFRRASLFCASLFGTASATAQEPALMEVPLSGWHSGALDREQQQWQAAYPKPPVDRGAQQQRTLIRGHLKQALRTGRRPPRLVVNGTAMPLYSDAQGQYARPYAFGRGSNSVALHDAQGQRLLQRQFIEVDNQHPTARLRAILTWDDPRAEVDMHVITPEGEHAFWANPVLKVGGGFDVDSVDGAGPEIFSSASPSAGTWLFYVNYWGNFNAAGYNFDDGAHDKHIITCTLSLITDENTAHEKRETLLIPLRKVGDLTLMRRLLWP